ncbi:MAG: hypothetical protein ABIP53_09145 [Candidatus Limnocylindrales bacterium]
MGSRDRPGREVKKKAKAKDNKPQLQSLMDSAPQSVELIKPKRKPRTEKEPEENEE